MNRIHYNIIHAKKHRTEKKAGFWFGAAIGLVKAIFINTEEDSLLKNYCKGGTIILSNALAEVEVKEVANNRAKACDDYNRKKYLKRKKIIKKFRADKVKAKEREKVLDRILNSSEYVENEYRNMLECRPFID